MKTNWLTGLMLSALTVFCACRKQDEVYKEFINGGEITYAHKADSVRAHPGNNRIQLAWLRGPSPDVTQAKVYWNSRADSIEIAIPDGDKLDTVKVLIDDIDEGIYTFEVITFDRMGNRSVAVDLLGTVYGDVYRSALRGRSVTASSDGSTLLLIWSGGSEDLLGEEVYYQTQEGPERKLFVRINEETSLLPDYRQGSAIRYRSLFRPDTLAIDTFYTDFEEVRP